MSEYRNEKYHLRGDIDDETISPEDLVNLFDMFIQEWCPMQMHGHLLDDDDNDAEYIRRGILQLKR